jgi:hypothetical protein
VVRSSVVLCREWVGGSRRLILRDNCRGLFSLYSLGDIVLLGVVVF